MATFQVVGVGSDGLNVRSGPGLSNQVIGTLDEGTIVQAEDGTTRADDLDWRRIVSPRTGFVADKFLDPADVAPPGEYVFPVQGWPRQTVPLHWGSHPGASDLFAARGTPVVAMRGGQVTDVGTAATDQFGGNNVLIQGDDGLTYYYAHGDREPQVDAGTTIATGTFLFGVNETGNAKGTGDHLHIGIGHGIQDGVGPSGGAGINFNAVALLQRVLDGAVPARRTGRPGQYLVRGTGHLGLRVREHPSLSAQVLTTLREDDVVDGEDTFVEADGRTWRRIHNPDGWAANEFLVPA